MFGLHARFLVVALKYFYNRVVSDKDVLSFAGAPINVLSWRVDNSCRIPEDTPNFGY